jgi:aspartate/methionine/tyrosine aminotransferase
MAEAWGLGVRTYELERGKRFEHSADRILAAVDERTRLVVVNSPHNPTGAVMPPLEVAKLAEALASREIPLLVDEVYHPLYFGAAAPSAARLRNTIVVGDMSKALSLSGLRIGAASASSTCAAISPSPARRSRKPSRRRPWGRGTRSSSVCSPSPLQTSSYWMSSCIRSVTRSAGFDPGAARWRFRGGSTGAIRAPSANRWRVPAY